jgi:hypothetical protein
MAATITPIPHVARQVTRLQRLRSMARTFCSWRGHHVTEEELQDQVEALLAEAREAGSIDGAWDLPDDFFRSIEGRLRRLVRHRLEDVDVDPALLGKQLLTVTEELHRLETVTIGASVSRWAIRRDRRQQRRLQRRLRFEQAWLQREMRRAARMREQLDRWISETRLLVEAEYRRYRARAACVRESSPHSAVRGPRPLGLRHGESGGTHAACG